MEYIYILKEREFIKTNEDIYKIGKTRQDNLGRFNNYPNGSSLYLQYFCNNSDFIELRIIDSFKENFIQRLDIGREYFEGNIDEMMNNIYHIRNQYSKLSKDEIDSIEINRINNMKNEALKKKMLRDEIRLKNLIIVENLKKKIEEYKKKEEEIINNHHVVKRVKNTKKISEEICDFFLKWFKENYRFTKEKRKYVSFNTLYHEFIVTKYYINLNNNQKKIYRKEYFFNFCKENENFSNYFRERYNNIRSIFTNYEKKNTENSQIINNKIKLKLPSNNIVENIKNIEMSEIINSYKLEEVLSEDELSEKALLEDELSEDELSEETLLEDELSEDELSEDELSEDELSEETLLEDELSEDELSEDELSEDELSENELSENELLEETLLEETLLEETLLEEDILQKKLLEEKKSEEDYMQNILNETQKFDILNNRLDCKKKYDFTNKTFLNENNIYCNQLVIYNNTSEISSINKSNLNDNSTLIHKNNYNGYTHSIEDNKKRFIEIMKKNTFELGHIYFCKCIEIIAGYRFVYKKYGDYYKLYCYNGTNWECDDILLKIFLSFELYRFLTAILKEVYWNHRDFNSLKSKIEKLKTLSYKKEIVETYKEFGTNNSIEFDDNWNLFGFTNVVYDLEKGEFREYKYDDYVSITCGYEWREPTEEEIENVENLIKSIMPIKEERELLLQILCTGLDGKCLEKFVIFNAGGGNGKGVINDLMLIALGNYGMLGNNGILFEYSKTGSNPEKANIHKKRYVVFREPPEKNKFENSVIKELTGGGTFSARNHHEKTAEKELNLTMVVECNKRPLFAEEPKESETRRIVDILFRSTFTADESAIDEEKFIFIANPDYKSKIFQEKHKFALLKILFDTYKTYLKNKCILQVP